MPKTLPTILETTLRDGSYAINFQFTARDTAIIAGELERVGFELIEIGHGIGLGASRKGMGVAAESDEAYLEAAAGALSRASFGMFCIPGVAALEDIDMAAGYGMGFIRIGTNVTEVASSKEYIARAKKHGMFVSTNYMKSYAMEPRQFAQTALLSKEYGADVLCVVDSAGGILHEELERYFRAVQEVCDIPLAFHGHNNLGLAIANSLLAVDLGAVIVDSSLQGLGRSAGNAPTEMLLAALNRKGFDLGIDLTEVMDIGEKYIRPLLGLGGWSSLDIISGFSQFHSSYMGVVKKYSSKYGVDPRKLIMRLCKCDKINAPEELVDKLASEMSSENDVYLSRFRFSAYHGNEQS